MGLIVSVGDGVGVGVGVSVGFGVLQGLYVVVVAVAVTTVVMAVVLVGQPPGQGRVVNIGGQMASASLSSLLTSVIGIGPIVYVGQSRLRVMVAIVVVVYVMVGVGAHLYSGQAIRSASA